MDNKLLTIPVMVYQHKDVKVIESKIKEFSNLCDCFVDNKLSKAKIKLNRYFLLLAKKSESLEIPFNDFKIKQNTKVTYLGCILDNALSGESLALHILNKVNSKLRFLYRKNRYLTPKLRRLLCNALIQPHFDFACSVWLPNLNKNIKNKLQTAQNKCIRFCLQLGNRSHIGVNEFEKINWLNIDDRFEQCVSANIFKFFNNNTPSYMNEIYELGNISIQTRQSYKKLKHPFRKSTRGQKCISYMGPSIWNKLPDKLKTERI